MVNRAQVKRIEGESMTAGWELISLTALVLISLLETVSPTMDIVVAAL